MGGKSSSSPKPDKNMGKAAMMSAQTGADLLAYMKDQAKVTNGWANEDRARYESTFQPLQDQYIAEAKAYDTPGRRAAAASAAVADVKQQAAAARQAQDRQLQASGVAPGSGRSVAETTRAGNAEALASAGAANSARKQVEATGDAMLGNAINMGQGLAVNPATSMGLSNGAMTSGAGGAMQGYGQQASILGNQYSQQMAGYNAGQASLGALGGALGTVAGAFLMSSKDVKKNKTRVTGILDALESMPVEKWDYEEGVADGGTHIGPYAEDFQAATGLGDGRTIGVIDALGLTMGAIQELSAKVKAMQGQQQGAPA